MKPAARLWFERRTSAAADWSLDRVTGMKDGATIAVVIPARDEAATVGRVVAQIRAELSGLVDELVVMDSLSSDSTAEIARAAGATVHSVADIRSDLGVRAGKGEALWKSAFVTTSDIVVFIDADLTEWGTHFITGLVGPLLETDDVHLAKGFYDRVLDTGVGVSLEGGRVTELVAKPWIGIHRPELSAVVQPLAGEWAIRRALFETLSIPVGYGVEMATLLDTHSGYGIDAICQVDLGRRAHRHQHVHDLAVMATEVLTVAHRRLDDASPVRVELCHLDDERNLVERTVSTDERPPIKQVRQVSPPGSGRGSPQS